VIQTAFVYFEIFTVGALILLAIGDLIFFIVGGKGETLSAQFWYQAKKWPIIPALLGVLFGHLVWQYDPDCTATTISSDLSRNSGLWSGFFGLSAIIHFAFRAIHGFKSSRDRK
jgi:hypothetical protein